MHYLTKVARVIVVETFSYVFFLVYIFTFIVFTLFFMIRIINQDQYIILE